MFAQFGALEWLSVALLVLVGLVLFAVALFLGWGLFQARSLIRREFTAYFLSPVGYVVLFAFLLVTAFLFYQTFELLTADGPVGTSSPMQSMFAPVPFWIMFLFIPPLLTMRLFAEERGSGTLEMLLTAPLRDWQVVLCKYVACLAFYVVLWLPTLLYLPVLMGAHAPVYDLEHWTFYRALFVAGLAALLLGGLLLLPRLGTRWRGVSVVLIGGGALAALAGGWLHYAGVHRSFSVLSFHVSVSLPPDPIHLIKFPITLADPWPVVTTYLGMFLAGAMLLALGLLVSSLVRDQMVAAILALAVSLVFIFAAFLPVEQDGGFLAQLVYFFTLPKHFERDFTRGVLDTRPLVLYVSGTLFCLFLTVRSVESRRWRA
jgi:ABC-type transport system involved in multi-copper enzyme maturation permease subunit